MRKILYLIFSLCVIFYTSFLYSCSSDSNSEVSFSENNESNNDKDGDNENDKEDKDKDDEILVTFKNNSSYKVNVYSYQNPLVKNTADFCINTNDSSSVKFSESKDSSGDVFYFEYLIPIGNVEFPYFSYSNSKIYCIEKNKANNIVIDELISCPSKSAYILFENESSNSVYLINGSSIIYPQNEKSYLLDSQKSAVYLLGENNGDIYYKTNLLKVQSGALTFDFPEIDFELGNVYTFVFSDSKIALKSVVPFDIETNKKIWRKDVDAFYVSDSIKPIIRPVKDLKNGSIVLGTLKNDLKKIGLLRIDSKGNFSSEIQTISFGNENYISRSLVLDFVEKNDGSIVFLVQNEFFDNSYKQLIANYDFNSKTLNWIYEFKDLMSFSLFSRNKLILNDEKICVVGSILESSEMHLWIGLFDENSKTLTFWKSSEFADFSNGIENSFTSVFYDKNENCYYACGFENCDYQYSNLIHSGIIYKFTEDLSSVQKIYSKEKTIFYCIDGDSSSNFFACGEFADNSNILKGILVSKENIKNNEQPILFTTKNPYCWFNQLCVYDSKIILCGKSCSDFAGNQNPKSFTASFNKNGKLNWSNESFDNFSDALSIIPNEINTYILELYSSNKHTIQLLSADLLGN